VRACSSVSASSLRQVGYSTGSYMMHAAGEFGVAGMLAFWAKPGCKAATIRGRKPDCDLLHDQRLQCPWLRAPVSLVSMSTAVSSGTVLDCFFECGPKDLGPAQQGSGGRAANITLGRSRSATSPTRLYSLRTRSCVADERIINNAVLLRCMSPDLALFHRSRIAVLRQLSEVKRM
jgi:hypothetical protein